MIEIRIGDARSLVQDLEPGSIDCVVTSPPYYALRDYGTGTWEGGDESCTHEAAKKKTRYDYSLASSPIQDGTRVGTDAQPAMFREICPSCGARRVDNQIGLERDPDAYVAELRDLFAGVRHALSKRGTFFLNIGDSYKDKELLGVPWRLALALQADRWKLRSDIIWAKPNPMVESTKDRPTKAHEYVFLFTRSSRYCWNYDAVKEAADWERWGEQTNRKGGAWVESAPEDWQTREWRNCRSVWEIPTQPVPEAHFATMPEALAERCIRAGCPEGGTVLDPFFGAGTTGLVARDLGRRCIGFELNPDYAEIAQKRIDGWNRRRNERAQLSMEVV